MNFIVIVLAVIGTITATPFEDDIGLRIVGGRNAANGQFPYQVSLQTGINSHICSGSIINNEWILTAANCIYETWQTIDAVAGTTNYKRGGVRYTVSKKVVHPQFNAKNKTNDIALLQLRKRIVFNNSTIRSVVLPLPTTPSSGLSMTTSGWGTTSEITTFLSEQLQFANVTAITIPQCQAAVPKPHVVGNTNVCTLGKAKLGSCKGDTGNPLIYNNVQHGILSYFVNCGKPYPDVYTSVAAYRMWINSVTGV